MGFIGPNYNKAYQQPLPPGAAGPLGAPTGPGLPLPGGGLPGARMVNLEALLTPLLMAQMTLNPEQTASLLRNLLKMPKEMVEFLAMMGQTQQSGGEALNKQVLQALLSENPHIALEDLQAVMQQKTKDGTEKLLNMLQHQQSTMAGQAGKDLSDMLKQVTQLSTRMSGSPVETLNQTLLLYLPWYPLEAPVRMQLYFEARDGEADEAAGEGEEYNLILLLETLALGKFKIVVGVRHKVQLLFRVEHDSLAQPHIPALQAAIIESLTGEALPPPTLEWTLRETALLQQLSGSGTLEKAAETGKQSLGVYPMGGASVLVVNAAYVAARVILEADRRLALLSGET